MNMTSPLAEIDTPTRLQSRGGRLLAALTSIYTTARPDVPPDSFKDRVFLRLEKVLRDDPTTLLRADGNFDGEALDSLILELEEFPIGVEVWFIYAACAQAIAASQAVESGDENRAWEMLADANFNLGWACSQIRGEAITDEMFSQRVASERSKAGTDARHRRTNELKAWAYEYVRGQTDWPSQASAVAALEGELKNKFGDDCLKDFEGTITNWLRKMPDREQNFKTVGANRSKA